jgi:putative PIN family toxin of toxin-antitoxin system
MVKVVIDANVIISAAFGGAPLDAVGKAFSTCRIFLSPEIAAEIETAIERLSPKLGRERTAALHSLWAKLRSLCRETVPVNTARICRDPKDDAYLGLCASIQADYLITGDKDLLSVDPARSSASLKGLRIVTPREFLEQAD